MGGVRRYQNPDGTLTEVGRKRYDNMSDKKLAKTFKKQIRSKRGEIRGSSNRFMNTEIGSNSKKALSDNIKNLKISLSSTEAKTATKRMKAINAALDKTTDSSKAERLQKQYDAEASKIEKIASEYGQVKYAVKAGKGFSEKFVNGAGKTISIAKLKDLGYAYSDAKKYVDRLAASNITLADM